MSKKSPLTLVKEKFGDKQQLVAAVQSLGEGDLWLGRTARDRGKDRGLENVSNAKLLRLHAIFSAVKTEFGSREKLIAAILTKELRTGDAGYKSRLEAYPVPRLWDAYKSVARREKRAVKKEKA